MLKFSRIIAIALIVCTALCMSVPLSLVAGNNDLVAFAAKASDENENAQMGSSIKKLKTGKEDEKEEKPVKIESMTSASGLNGIDISYWQGNLSDSDWKNIKKSVDFVIIRCGYGENKKEKDDSKFIRNAEACIKYDIPFGVYIYSYATSVAGAKDEADHALRMVQGYAPEYPIYYDLEDVTVAKAGNATIQQMSKAFCERITAAGYRAGVYANLDWWNNKIKTGADGYSKWIAQWGGSCTYKKPYHIWQYSSYGYIKGISQRFDVNKLMCSKSTMDEFMEGAYQVFTGKAKDVENYEAVVTKDGAQLMSGPGRSYVKQEKLPIGTTVYVTEVYGGYAHLVSEDMASINQLSGGDGDDVITDDGSTVDEDTSKDIDSWIALSSIANVTSIKGWETTETGKKLVKYNGEYVTGFVKYGKYYYGFDENGDQYIKQTAMIGDKKYLFSSSGKAILSKNKVVKKTVLRSGPGTKYKKTGKLKKRKYVYVIRTYGNWSQTTSGNWFYTKDSKKVVKYPQ